jgi:hypothetical protein
MRSDSRFTFALICLALSWPLSVRRDFLQDVRTSPPGSSGSISIVFRMDSRPGCLPRKSAIAESRFQEGFRYGSFRASASVT